MSRSKRRSRRFGTETGWTTASVPVSQPDGEGECSLGRSNYSVESISRMSNMISFNGGGEVDLMGLR